jgi:hypothetical protein
VLDELPTITQITVPVTLHEEQQSIDASYAKAIAGILRKKIYYALRPAKTYAIVVGYANGL